LSADNTDGPSQRHERQAHVSDGPFRNFLTSQRTLVVNVEPQTGRDTQKKRA
jgi:hypothetical protein